MLTETQAKKMQPADKPLADGTVTGLTLEPGNAKGRGKWNLRFVSPVTGKRRDMGLGIYPEVSIATARELAGNARKLLGQGKDPIEERKKQRREAQAVTTFRQAAQETYGAKKGGFRNQKHTNQWINTLTEYVFPIIGDTDVRELKASDFQKALKPIWLSKPETAGRVRQRCKTVMDWCVAKELIPYNPVSTVQLLLEKQPGKRERVEHHPAMAWKELPAFVATVLRPNGSISALALEFLILTVARSGEVRGMRWTEVDLEAKTWTVPKDRMKAKVEHVVPLPARALEILQARKDAEDQLDAAKRSGLVFPSRNNTPLSDMALTSLLRRVKAKSANSDKIATAHGFRSSFRDWVAETGKPSEVAERALAHTIRNAVEAAYNRTTLFTQRRRLMTQWATFVESGAESNH